MTAKRECVDCRRDLPVAAFEADNSRCRVCAAIGYARARNFPRDHARIVTRTLERLRVPDLIAARANVRKAA